MSFPLITSATFSSEGQSLKLPTFGLCNILTTPFGSKQIEFFTKSRTWTVPENVTEVRVRLWGAGSGNSTYGNSGGFAMKTLSVTPGANVTITVGAAPATAGAGGNTSFGGLVTATGGTTAAGGVGTGVNGDVNISGNSIEGTNNISGMAANLFVLAYYASPRILPSATNGYFSVQTSNNSSAVNIRFDSTSSELLLAMTASKRNMDFFNTFSSVKATNWLDFLGTGDFTQRVQVNGMGSYYIATQTATDFQVKAALPGGGGYGSGAARGAGGLVVVEY